MSGTIHKTSCWDCNIKNTMGEGCESNKHIFCDKSLSEHDKQIRTDAIDECLKVIRKGMEELLRSPWANKKYLREFDLSVEEAFEVIEHLILRKDIEQLKENDNE